MHPIHAYGKADDGRNGLEDLRRIGSRTGGSVGLQLSVGDRVVWLPDEGGQEYGFVRWMGSGVEEGPLAGIEFVRGIHCIRGSLTAHVLHAMCPVSSWLDIATSTRLKLGGRGGHLRKQFFSFPHGASHFFAIARSREKSALLPCFPLHMVPRRTNTQLLSMG